MYLPFTVPNTSAKGAGNGKIFVSSSLNLSVTASSVGNSVNLTASGASNPWILSTDAATSNTSSTSSSSSASAADVFVSKVPVLSLFAVVAGVLGGAALV